MTREQLAKIDASKVRKDGKLSAEFKRFVVEDAPLLYSSGKIPPGCFGCQFKSIFNKWSSMILGSKTELTETKQPKGVKKMDKKTYKLANQATKFYFRGKVLSKESGDAAWIEWIQYPKDKKKVEARKNNFEVLPEALQPKKKVEKPSVEDVAKG